MQRNGSARYQCVGTPLAGVVRTVVTGILVALFLMPLAAVGQSKSGGSATEEKLQRKRVDDLVRTLSNCKVERERIAATQALGQMGPKAKSAVPALLKALDSPQKVRLETIRTLGLVGPGARDAVPELGALLKLRKDVDTLLQALGRIGGKDAAAAVIPLLRKEDKAHWKQCVAALGMIGEDASAVVPHLLKLLSDTDKSIVQYASSALHSIGPGEATNIPALIQLLGKLGYVERTVVMLLGRSGKAAFVPLNKALKSDNEKVRLDVIRSLHRNTECTEDVIPILRKYLHDPAKWVRVESACGLAQILKRRKDLTERVALGLVEALGTADTGLTADHALKSVPKYLAVALKHKDPKVRARACTVAANWEQTGEKHLSTEKYLSTFMQMMSVDKEPMARYAASRALGRMAIQPNKVVPALIEALKDKNSHVRAGVCIAIKGYGKDATDALPAVV